MAPTITQNGTLDRLAPCTALQSRCFLDDPIMHWILSTRAPAKIPTTIPHIIRVLFKSAALNGGFFDEAFLGPANDGPACSALWMPPGTKIDGLTTHVPAGFVGLVLFHIGLRGLARMLKTQQLMAPLKKQTFGSRRFLYLFFIGTDESARGQGLSSALIRRQQEHGRADGLPIWLESSSAKSHGVYLKLGFRDVKVFALGEGKVDAQGRREKGGPGVAYYAMVWWPEEAKESVEQS